MNTIGNRILIIDSDKNFLENTSEFLREKGFEVWEATHSLLGVEKAKNYTPNLILLDIDFPDVDGIEICQTLREIPELNNTLITFLSNHTEDFVQIACFKAGADDYFSKPIKNNVLYFRIQALLKRNLNIVTQNQHISTEINGLVEIDTEKFIVKVGSQNVSLPKKQFFLLQLLMSRPSKVYSRELILELIWGSKNRIGGRVVDVYIRKLREKIGSKHIVTIKGVGYRFDQ
ncbi:MAG TPA: DNA-binding response regulator [Bacteroidales bacterium]|nr:DNA-binding response regulator [Bacteroidales bacterium]